MPLQYKTSVRGSFAQRQALQWDFEYAIIGNVSTLELHLFVDKAKSEKIIMWSVLLVQHSTSEGSSL